MYLIIFLAIASQALETGSYRVGLRELNGTVTFPSYQGKSLLFMIVPSRNTGNEDQSFQMCLFDYKIINHIAFTEQEDLNAVSLCLGRLTGRKVAFVDRSRALTFRLDPSETVLETTEQWRSARYLSVADKRLKLRNRITTRWVFKRYGVLELEKDDITFDDISN